MLKSGKYDLVHKFFGKMMRSGLATKALAYKGSVTWAFFITLALVFVYGFLFYLLNSTVLVRAFWEENKVDEAIEAVKDMEQRGVVGTAGVYYELACCLCHNGRWQEAMVQVSSFLETIGLVGIWKIHEDCHLSMSNFVTLWKHYHDIQLPNTTE